MRLATIGARLATHLRAPALVTAGLRHAYYPAPAQIAEGPAAVIFAGLGNAQPWSEQIWHHELRVQLMQPATGFPVQELNALEALLEPIWDHFAPGTNASRLIVPNESGWVEHCYPVRYEGSLLIEYANTPFTAITITFEVKTHRFAGGQ